MARNVPRCAFPSTQRFGAAPTAFAAFDPGGRAFAAGVRPCRSISPPRPRSLLHTQQTASPHQTLTRINQKINRNRPCHTHPHRPTPQPQPPRAQTTSPLCAHISVLDDLGEEITGISAPVSICMALVVLLVKLLNPEGESDNTSVVIASLAYAEQVRCGA